MLALVGSEAPFDHGRQQIELLAGLEVTAKAVERTAEGIGADIAAADKREIARALQLNLPIDASRITGKRAKPPKFHFHVAHPASGSFWTK